MKRESERKIQKRPELVAELTLSVLLIGLSVYAIIDSVQIASAIAREPVGPAFLPRALGIGLIVLAAPLLVRSTVRLFKMKAAKETIVQLRPSGSPNAESSEAREALQYTFVTKPGYLFFATMALSALYVTMLQYRILWFPIATVAYLATLGTVVMLKERVATSIKKFASLLLVSAALSVFLEAMFRYGLRLRLP